MEFAAFVMVNVAIAYMMASGGLWEGIPYLILALCIAFLLRSVWTHDKP